MFRSVRGMGGKQVVAINGQIGRVDRFILDEQNWAVRYVAVDIGGWHSGRKILISPVAMEGSGGSFLKVNALKEQVWESPGFDPSKPLSRDLEIELHDYYSWPYYWAYPAHYNSLGAAIFTEQEPKLLHRLSPPRDKNVSGAFGMEPNDFLRMKESHLCSTKELLEFVVRGSDEGFGYINDLLIDMNEWAIGYFVADAGNATPGKMALISPCRCLGIDHDEMCVRVAGTVKTTTRGAEDDTGCGNDREP